MPRDRRLVEEAEDPNFATTIGQDMWTDNKTRKNRRDSTAVAVVFMFYCSELLMYVKQVCAGARC